MPRRTLLEAADRKARAVVENLRAARMNTAADLVERSVSETLTYYAFPESTGRRFAPTIPASGTTKEIRRRTRVVRTFPDGQSCLRLGGRPAAAISPAPHGPPSAT